MLRNYDDILFWCKNQNFSVKEKIISFGKQIVATKKDIRISINVYKTGTILVQGAENKLKSQAQEFIFGDKKVNNSKDLCLNLGGNSLDLVQQGSLF